MCLAAVTFTQYKHIIQMICASSVTNQSHNISTQILCKFKVTITCQTVTNLKSWKSSPPNYQNMRQNVTAGRVRVRS